MTLQADAKLGLAMRFDVIVDELNLGSWASCTGLGVEFTPVEVHELGTHETTQYIPGNLKYSKVSLTRAVTKDDSATTLSWLQTQAAKNGGGSSAGELIGGAALSAFAGIAATALGMTGSKPAGSATVKITLRDAYYAEVCSWTLRNAYPSKWSLGGLEATSNKVALETLELVHEGFL
ncbi:MAG TPA: phage tail protein [Acidimicrobiales bacterium]